MKQKAIAPPLLEFIPYAAPSESTNSEKTEWIYIQIHQPEVKCAISKTLQLCSKYYRNLNFSYKFM